MSLQHIGQDERALRKNATFFAENERYKSNQDRLEHYRAVAQSATHEVETAQRLLDIGNGGLFLFPIAHIPDVEAIDVFVEESFAQRYPKVRWREMSVLDLNDRDRFDTVIAINCLHHVVGNTVRQSYDNLSRILQVAFQALETGGKLVLIESTVPAWFSAIYKPIYPLLLKIWMLKHPPTFQYHFRDIQHAAFDAGFKQVEFAWIPKIGNIMAFGVEVPGWLSPVRIAKLVYRKQVDQ